jgi:hypothetical protein
MSGDEMSVGFFGSVDGGVAEQELDRSNIRALRQQLYCERIAETVRMSVEARKGWVISMLLAYQRGEADQQTAHVGRAGFSTGLARPEKVRASTVDQGERGEGARRVGMEQDFERRTGFGDAQSEMAGNRVESVTTKTDYIGYAKTGIEEGIEQSAGAVADLEGRIEILCSEVIAGFEQSLYFGASIGQSSDLIYPRHSNLSGRAFGDDVMFFGPGKEAAEMTKFFGPGAGGDGAARTVRFEVLSGYRRDKAGAGEMGKEWPEGDFVGVKRTVRERFGGAGDGKATDGFGQGKSKGGGRGEGLREGVGRVESVGVGLTDLLERYIPFGSAQRLADRVAAGLVGLADLTSLARQYAIHPDRAGAEGEVLTLEPMRTGFKMAAVRGKGGGGGGLRDRHV